MVIPIATTDRIDLKSEPENETAGAKIRRLIVFILHGRTLSQTTAPPVFFFLLKKRPGHVSFMFTYDTSVFSYYPSLSKASLRAH